jgi:hypothetical protein
MQNLKEKREQRATASLLESRPFRIKFGMRGCFPTFYYEVLTVLLVL